MSKAQEKELIVKFWEEVCEIYGLQVPQTAQGKKITKEFITSCRKLVNDSVAVGNAAQSAHETSTSSSKKKKEEKVSSSKRVKAADETGDQKTKKKVTIDPKATTKKATSKKATATKKKASN